MQDDDIIEGVSPSPEAVHAIRQGMTPARLARAAERGSQYINNLCAVTGIERKVARHLLGRWDIGRPKR